MHIIFMDANEARALAEAARAASLVLRALTAAQRCVCLCVCVHIHAQGGL
jgi:hypothetical protein